MTEEPAGYADADLELREMHAQADAALLLAQGALADTPAQWDDSEPHGSSLDNPYEQSPGSGLSPHEFAFLNSTASAREAHIRDEHGSLSPNEHGSTAAYDHNRLHLKETP